MDFFERSSREGHFNRYSEEAMTPGQIAELCETYNRSWLEALYDGVVSPPGEKQDQEIEAVFEEIEPVLSKLQECLDQGHLDRPLLTLVTKTVASLDRLTERLMARRQANFH